MQDKERPPKIKFCNLWENKTKDGQMFLCGSLGNNSVLVFKNAYKKEDKHPDWVAYITPSDKKFEKKEEPKKEWTDATPF